MTKLAKSHFVVRRSKSSTMLSGAATLTFDSHMSSHIVELVLHGSSRDMKALRSDSKRAFKAVSFHQSERDDERLVAG